MLNDLIAFKDTVIKKFGPVLGYAMLIVGALIALSILGFLLRTVFAFAIWLVVAGAVVFGIYKLIEMFKTNKS
jgi:Zn-dependent protease